MTDVADRQSLVSAAEAAHDLPRAALDLARIFSAGGRLVATAPGRADHARHVAVEFVHPAITGAKSLPSFAVGAGELSSLLPTDALVVLGADLQPLERDIPECSQLLVTDSLRGPELVRWYHVLWELVQLGLDHPGLTGGATDLGGSDSTSFLYPFLDAAETDEPALLASMAASAASKEQESVALGARTVAANANVLDAVAAAVTRCSETGGTFFAIGNGGSSCDAARVVRLLRNRGVRAISLAEDPAILTALANDLGVNHVFARQVEATVRPGDVLLALSTSGSSANLLAAFDVDVAARATVVACAGYGGGPLALHPQVDHALVVDSSSVHRIQEAQAMLIDAICDRIDASARTERPEVSA